MCEEEIGVYFKTSGLTFRDVGSVELYKLCHILHGNLKRILRSHGAHVDVKFTYLEVINIRFDTYGHILSANISFNGYSMFHAYVPAILFYFSHGCITSTRVGVDPGASDIRDIVNIAFIKWCDWLKAKKLKGDKDVDKYK